MPGHSHSIGPGTPSQQCLLRLPSRGGSICVGKPLAQASNACCLSLMTRHCHKPWSITQPLPFEGMGTIHPMDSHSLLTLVCCQSTKLYTNAQCQTQKVLSVLTRHATALTTHTHTQTLTEGNTLEPHKSLIEQKVHGPSNFSSVTILWGGNLK